MSNTKVFKDGVDVCIINVDKIIRIEIYDCYDEDKIYKQSNMIVFLKNDNLMYFKINYNLEEFEKKSRFLKNFNILLNSNIDYIDLSDSDLCETILNGPECLVPQEIESIDDLVSNVKNIFKSCDAEVTLK